MRRALLTFAVIFACIASALGLTPGQSLLLFGGWHFPGASVDLNFATGQYFGLQPSQLTVSRASVENEVCNGQLYSFAANQAAITPGCGLWVWEARTNGITDNSMANAVPGTPGTLPNLISDAPNGLTRQIVAVGSTNGVPSIDIRYFGTTTNGNGVLTMIAGYVPISYGQTAAYYIYATVVGGSAGNISEAYLQADEKTAGGGYLSSHSAVIPLTSNPLLSSKVQVVFTASNPTVAEVLPYVLLTAGASAAIDITLRIAVQQFELNPNVPATVASAVMAASGAGGVNGVGVYTVTGGTCTTQPTLNVTWAAGVLTVNSVANAGSCSVLPPSPATLAYTSGAATGWTGATVTLTPTDNSAQGFATGPILTSSGAVARLGTVITAPAPIMATSTLYVKATPYAPTAYSVNQYFAMLGGASGTTLIRFAGGGAAYGAGGGGYGMGQTLTQAAQARLGIAYGGGGENYSVNGITGSAANAASFGTGLNIGTLFSGTTYCNCSISRLTLFPSKLSAAALGALN